MIGISIVYLVLCAISTLNAASTSTVISKTAEEIAREEHASYKKMPIQSQRNNFYVWAPGHATPVTKFGFETPFTFDCYMEFLPIEFQEWNIKSETWVTVAAFLSDNYDQMPLTQNKTATCRNIRRYFFINLHFCICILF